MLLDSLLVGTLVGRGRIWCCRYPPEQAQVSQKNTTVVDLLINFTMSDELLFKAIKNEASIEEVKRILEEHPEAVTVKNNVGYLPLHFALRCKASHEIVEMLFNANPEATKAQDNYFGSLPLHLPLYYKYSKDIIKMLYEANPEATKVQDNDGCLPLQYALWFTTSDDIIEVIFNANPDATKVKDNHGSLPLHVALYCKASNEIVKMIYEANTEATKVQDNFGSLPLHYALRIEASDEIITMILHANPDAVFGTENDMWMTPLHYACHYKASKEVVQILINAAQRSDSVAHVKHLPPPQRASAICSLPCKHGRTLLWYALHYNAPDGIVELP
jgi:ankyrin repeat protein